jgi:para-nitrobenzyl esterase
MHAAWVRFATDGDPGWEAWNPAHPVHVFGDGPPHTAHGHRDAELALWTTGATDRPAPAIPAPATADGSPACFTEPRAVIRRLRRSGGVRDA